MYVDNVGRESGGTAALRRVIIVIVSNGRSGAGEGESRDDRCRKEIVSALATDKRFAAGSRRRRKSDI